MIILTKHSLFASLPTGGEELKDEVIDKISGDVEGAVLMGLSAVIEALRERFPDVRFTLTEN